MSRRNIFLDDPRLRTLLALGRKVRITASMLGLSDQIEVREIALYVSADSIRARDPLGKIPVLILHDGTAYCDSRVILEVLDHLDGGGRIIPFEPTARFAATKVAA